MASSYRQDGYQLVRHAIPLADLKPFRDRIRDQVGVYAQALLDEGKPIPSTRTCPSANAWQRCTPTATPAAFAGGIFHPSALNYAL